MKSFMFGLDPNISDYPLKETENLCKAVGGNTGNLAFHYAIQKQLGLKTVVPWSAFPQDIDNAGSLGVIPCANQLGPHANFSGMAAKLGKTQAKYVAIGLGAQSGIGGKLPVIPEGTLKWLEQIVEHSPSGNPNITVRGDFTLEVLDSYGFKGCAVSLGCPTLFINPDRNLGSVISGNLREPRKVAVLAGHYKWKHLKKLEASLLDIASRDGAYITQSPKDMIKLGRGEVGESLDDYLEIKEYLQPRMTDNEFGEWVSSHANVFFDVLAWMEFYRRFDFVIGPRIHGVILALQAGVPGACIVHDSRTLELCESMKVPYVLAKDHLEGLDVNKVVEEFEFSQFDFDKNREEKSVRFNDFLVNNLALNEGEVFSGFING